MKTKTELQEYIRECDCDAIQKHDTGIKTCKHSGVENVDRLTDCFQCRDIPIENIEDGCHRDKESILLPTTQQLIDMLGDRFMKLQQNIWKNEKDFFVDVTIDEEKCYHTTGKSTRLALIKAVKEINK